MRCVKLKIAKKRTNLASISVRKEISVNFLEFLYTQASGRAIFEKPFVPFLDLGVYNEVK